MKFKRNNPLIKGGSWDTFEENRLYHLLTTTRCEDPQPKIGFYFGGFRVYFVLR